jgi:hypothetical protein
MNADPAEVSSKWPPQTNIVGSLRPAKYKITTTWSVSCSYFGSKSRTPTFNALAYLAISSTGKLTRPDSR